MTSLDDYETHFTVMNYLEGSTNKLFQLHYDEFIPEFEAQNPKFMWSEVVVGALFHFSDSIIRVVVRETCLLFGDNLKAWKYF